MDWRTVEKNVSLPLEMMGWERAARRDRVHELLELVELTGSRATIRGSSRAACSSASRSPGRSRSSRP